MPLRRRLADAVRHRLVPSAAELDELRERVRVRETELAEARQRIRSLEREMDRLRSSPTPAKPVAAPAAAAAQAAPAQEAPAEAAPSTGGQLFIVDEECVGCGTCVDFAPDAFQMDRSRVIAEVVSQGAPADQVEEAMLACPTQCIRRSES